MGIASTFAPSRVAIVAYFPGLVIGAA